MTQEERRGPGSDQSYTVTVAATLDDEKLAAALANLHCVTAATPTSDACISAFEEGKPFTIIPEVQGNELDMDKMKAAVKSALLNQKKQIRLADEDCYKKITVKSDDANLVQLCTTLKRIQGYPDYICVWIQQRDPGWSGTGKMGDRDERHRDPGRP